MVNYSGVITAWINGVVKDIEGAAKNAVQESVEEGESLVRGRVSSLNRIESGKMIGSVSGEVLGSSSTEVTGRFGFKDTPYWTVYQEYGTQNVEAMYALTDAAETVLGELEGKIRSGL